MHVAVLLTQLRPPWDAQGAVSNAAILCVDQPSVPNFLDYIDVLNTRQNVEGTRVACAEIERWCHIYPGLLADRAGCDYVQTRELMREAPEATGWQGLLGQRSISAVRALGHRARQARPPATVMKRRCSTGEEDWDTAEDVALADSLIEDAGDRRMSVVGTGFTPSSVAKSSDLWDQLKSRKFRGWTLWHEVAYSSNVHLMRVFASISAKTQSAFSMLPSQPSMQNTQSAPNPYTPCPRLGWPFATQWCGGATRTRTRTRARAQQCHGITII